MGSYLLLASDARTVEKRRGRNSRKIVRPSRWGCPQGQGEAMAIDQVDRRVVIERPTVTSRQAGRGAAAPATTSFTKTYRTTAKVVGAVYLGGFVVGLVGSGVFQSILGATGASANLSAVAASSVLLAFGAILWLMAVAGDAAHGVLMFPILRRYHERIAFGYLASRIVDAVFIAVMVLFVLLQIPLASAFVKAAVSDTSFLQTVSGLFAQGQVYAYDIGMITLGVSGLMLCYTLYRAKLLPRVVAGWGLIGYAILFVGMLSDVMGSGLGLASSIPGGLWEVFVGVWLIANGFSSSGLAQHGKDASQIDTAR